ncbi:FHA domain-containing protein [Streptomyces sp. TP-A0874]|uniref:FHA domain-containing protein n=1 Tax=Streptomyces sp. TP-A0874 TaxID=549819 RepID=UPI00085308BA|nr:FHA domain-containing protein [Streptomyces sp. TP-A0874]
MPTCPNGHQSGSDDWCEVCGHRMAGGPSAGAVPPPPPPAPGHGGPPPPPPPAATGGYGYPQPPGGGRPQAELCPQCRTPREAQAPFCEQCRYNFLTHSPTSFTPPHQQPHGMPPPPPGFAQHTQQPQPGFQPGQPQAPQGGSPAEQRLAPPAGLQVPAPQPPAPARGAGSGGGDDWTLPPPPGSAPAPHGGGPSFGGDHGPGRPGPAAPPQQTSWVAVVAPDREYFTAMMARSGPEASGLSLPAYSPEQQLTLSGQQVTIGRRRQSTGESPDIDLSRPPEDPGVSHQHAILVQGPEGNWSVIDQNSTNGTTVNNGEEPIQPFVPVQLNDGDRVHVGAWTTITVRRG